MTSYPDTELIVVWHGGMKDVSLLGDRITVENYYQYGGFQWGAERLRARRDAKGREEDKLRSRARRARQRLAKQQSVVRTSTVPSKSSNREGL